MNDPEWYGRDDPYPCSTCALKNTCQTKEYDWEDCLKGMKYIDNWYDR